MLFIHMLLPTFLMHVHTTSSAEVDVDSSFLSANRTMHWLPPILFLLPHSYFVTYCGIEKDTGITIPQGYFHISAAANKSQQFSAISVGTA